MYWGCEVSTEKPHSMVETEEEKFEEESKMLHVSNASLNTTKKTEKGGKFKVYCQVGDKKFIIANLQEGTTENYALDLYFKQDEPVTFSLVGKGGASVHLTGYWETSALSMEDDYGMGPLEMDMDEEEDYDLDPATRNAIDQAKANAVKNALAGMHDDEEEEESEEEDEPLIPAKAPKAVAVTTTTKTVKVTAPAKKVEESDEEEESEDDFQPVNAPAAAEDSDEESESEEAPGLVNAGANKKAAKQAVFEEEDSDEDSDEFDVKAILANKKRKAGDEPAAKVDQKRQKVNENKEKNVGKGQKQNQQQHQKQNQHKQHQQKHHNQNKNQNQEKGGHKKRHNKHHNKNKGGRK